VELAPEQKPVSTNLVPVTFTHLASGSEKHIVASVPPETPPRASSAFGNTTLFQGRLWVPELGLYYYRARWYDPQLVNFIERDPAGYADSPNLMQAFGLNPVSNRDPWGRWVIPPDAGPAWNYSSSWGIPKIARGLLLTEVSLAYLNYRFGALAKKAGLDVKTEVERATAPNSGPKVVFNTARLDTSSERGIFDDKEDTIVLRTEDQDPDGNFHGPGPSATREEKVKFRRALRIGMAIILGHETVHYLSKRITAAARKGQDCVPPYQIDPQEDPKKRPQPCWFLHDDFSILPESQNLDIGGKWQFMLFGEKGPAIQAPVANRDFDWEYFTEVTTQEYALLMKGVTKEEINRRGRKIADLLFTEWLMLSRKYYPLEPDWEPWVDIQ
jgi:RHS repeat-associated protein